MLDTIQIDLQTDELDLLKEFLEESTDPLADVEDMILQLEERDDNAAEVVQAVFRIIHTIKGTSGFFGLLSMERLGHRIEGLLDLIRQNRIMVDADTTDCLLSAMDRLKRLLEATDTASKQATKTKAGVTLNVENISVDDILQWIETETGKADSPQPATETAKDSEHEEEAIDPSAFVLPKDLCKDYLEESNEHLQVLEQKLLAAENLPELANEAHDALLRSFHTIKGNTDLLLSHVVDEKAKSHHILQKVHSLTHSLEHLLQTRKNSKSKITGNEITLFLKTHDRLKQLLFDIANGIHIGGPAIDDLLREADSAATLMPLSGTEEYFFLVRQSTETIATELNKIKQAEKDDAALTRIHTALSELKTAAETNPELKDLAMKANESINLVEFLGDNWSEEVKIFCLPDLEECLATFKNVCPEKPSAPSPEANIAKQPVEKKEVAVGPPMPSPIAGSKLSVIKVPQERLDQLMNLTGELLVERNALNHMSGTICSSVEIETAGRMKELENSLGHIVDELQVTVMAMRMVPVGHVFAKFPRLVRDLSRKLGKEIRLEIEGADTEIDKTIVEALGDPLVHIVRNSADHGIEKAEERPTTGKPPESIIRLQAFNEGQNVIIKVTDDGRGIDADMVRDKILQRGLATEEEVSQLTDKQVLDFIFEPGFSTAKKVTEVSGRGVGMDVVRKGIESVGGKVSLESVPNQGTAITMLLPLTLSVNRGLEVAVGNEHFYIPLEYVAKTVKVEGAAIHSHHGDLMVTVRGRVLKMYHLSSLLGITTDDASAQNSGMHSLVILDIKGNSLALKVDRFFREGEYVLKNLPGILKSMPMVMGTMITPAGNLILVLDPLQLIA